MNSFWIAYYYGNKSLEDTKYKIITKLYLREHLKKLKIATRELLPCKTVNKNEVKLAERCDSAKTLRTQNFLGLGGCKYFNRAFFFLP